MTLRPGGLELPRTADVLEAVLELGRSDWERGLVRTASGGIVTRETRVPRRPCSPIYVAGGVTESSSPSGSAATPSQRRHSDCPSALHSALVRPDSCSRARRARCRSASASANSSNIENHVCLGDGDAGERLSIRNWGSGFVEIREVAREHSRGAGAATSRSAAERYADAGGFGELEEGRVTATPSCRRL